MALKEKVDLTGLDREQLDDVIDRDPTLAGDVLKELSRRDRSIAAERLVSDSRERVEAKREAVEARRREDEKYEGMNAQIPAFNELLGHVDPAIDQVAKVLEEVIRAAEVHGHSAAGFGIGDKAGDFRHRLECIIMDRLASTFAAKNLMLNPRRGTVYGPNAIPSATVDLAGWAQAQVNGVRLHRARKGAA